MRLFLATPDEIADIRDVVRRIADSIGEFQVLDWSSHVDRQADAEAAALVPVEDDDVFLGIAWLRFGMAGTADDAETTASQPFRSSTEQDFELAYRSWATQARASAIFYRSMQLPKSLSDINGEQLARVDRFFGRFQDGKSPGFYNDYETPEEFEKRLRSDLAQAVQSYKRSATPRVMQPPQPAGEEAGPIPEYARKMQPGKAYEVSFLSLEMVSFPEIVVDHLSESEGVETLHRCFKHLVAETAAAYGGEVFSWDSELGQGLLMFWSRRSYDHAIITGLKVIHGLPVFNLDPLQNPLGLNLEIRTAAHDAVIVFQLPASEISSVDVDYVLDLRRNYTNPGELCITRRLLERADSRLKARFKGKGRYEREPIYSCRLPSTEQHALRFNLEEVIKKAQLASAAVRESLTLPPPKLEPATVEKVSAGVDEFYALLNRATTLLSSINRSWSKKFFAELAAFVNILTTEEGKLWQALRRSIVDHAGSREVAQRLETLVHTVSARRSRPTVTLSKSEQGLRSWAYGESEVKTPAKADEELIKKIEAFLRADPLDNETAVTDLLLNKKTSLLAYLARPRPEEIYVNLKAKLWESADLLLLDDLYSIRGHQRSTDQKIFDVMTQQPVADGRFRAVQQLLAEEFRPAESLVKQHFEENGVEGENKDVQIVWRSIVLGHPVIKIRTLAALKMSQFSMWQAIAHPNVPIASIHSIGERVAKGESEDAKKIFFDCVRDRIVTAVETFRTREELKLITKLILLLLDFSFLVETGYFERFDDVLEKFLARSQKLNLEVEYFVNLRTRLESAKHDPDTKTAAKPPKGITKLPLTLQRRLAGEKHYLNWFVTHPDPRIACETLRHITLSTVERVLRSPEVNGVVMASLLRKPELFTRSGALLAALNNPKCDLMFANRHLPNLGRSRAGLQSLEKLSKNPSANAAVRSAAQRFVQQQKGSAGRGR